MGLETLGGICTKLIERNTTIPTKKSQIFSTAVDNQPSVEIHVLQGEREMAADNKTLGTFRLDGIAPAPRGVPQIEVTFDIDANGIVNVTAKDMGTGKQQNITITASTNLSKEDIEKAVKEAENYAGEDAKKKEEIEIRNNADQLVYQTEKLVNDAGDKLTADDKGAINTEVEKVKEALKGTDSAAIKSAADELQKKLYEFSSKIYAQANPEAAAGAAPGADTADAASGSADGNVYDADFTDADDKK